MPPITKKYLKAAAEMMTRATGQSYEVVPFPGGPGSGYNLIRDGNIVKGGKPAKDLFEWMHAYTAGYRDGKIATAGN